jgi:histidyl-tRNA synthetase
MIITPKTLKGFRDFLPEEARKRQYLIGALKKVFERYGFEPLETPSLEYEDILLGKYGDEGDKLMYRFEDNGQRRVSLRYDQTVPLARVIAQYENVLPLPFKRYQVSNVWRAENTQRGRFREFLQCDIDTVGVDSALSDSEIIKVVITTLESLGVKSFKILLNDRAVFADIPKEGIAVIDKLKKIGRDGVLSELKEKAIDSDILTKISESNPTQ